MAYGTSDIAGYAGALKQFAADIISSVHFQRIKAVWGGEGVVKEWSNATPPPVANGLVTVTGHGEGTIPTTAGGQPLPGVGDITPLGSTAVALVESGSIRWTADGSLPTSSHGQPVGEGSNITLPLGAQLADVLLIGIGGDAVVSVVYSTSGEG